MSESLSGKSYGSAVESQDWREIEQKRSSSWQNWDSHSVNQAIDPTFQTSSEPISATNTCATRLLIPGTESSSSRGSGVAASSSSSGASHASSDSGSLLYLVSTKGRVRSSISLL